MNENKTIVLIDMGDEVVWCDSVPSNDIQPEDVTEYILMSEYRELQAVIGVLNATLEENDLL